MSKKHSDKQIGGEHYKHMKIQVTEFVSANDIPFIEGNVIKYVCRHAHKNGKEDVLKAIHYLNLLLEYNYNESHDIQKRIRQESPTPHSTTTSVDSDSEWEVEYTGI